MAVEIANVRASDPRNMALAAGLRCMYRKKGSTDHADWIDFGDIEDGTLSPTIDRFEHSGVRRGQRAKDREIISNRELMLNVNLHELNPRNVLAVFGADEGDVTDEVTFIMDDFIATNPGDPGTIEIGQEDIIPSSVILRTTAEEFVDEKTWVNPTDYTFDENTGIITITPAGGLAVVDEAQDNEEVHIFWRKDVEAQKFEAFSGKEILGEVRFMMINADGPSWIWYFPNVQLKINGDVSLGDGTELISLPLTIQALADRKGAIMTKYMIKAGQLDLVC